MCQMKGNFPIYLHLKFFSRAADKKKLTNVKSAEGDSVYDDDTDVDEPEVNVVSNEI